MLAYLEGWLTKDELQIAKSVADFNLKLGQINGLKSSGMLSLTRSLALAKQDKGQAEVVETEAKAKDKLIPVRKPVPSKGVGRRA